MIYLIRVFFFQIIFWISFWHPIIKLYKEWMNLNLFFQLLHMNSNFRLTLGYINPALNNPAMMA